MADDAALNPNKLSEEALKEFAPGLRPFQPKVDIERRKETLLRNRKTLAEIRQKKYLYKDAARQNAREKRRKLRDQQREKEKRPESARWKDANYFIYKHLEQERTATEIAVNQKRLGRAEKVRITDVLLMVTRISAPSETPKATCNTFAMLRLNEQWTSVFVRRTKTMLNWLFVIRKYIKVVMPNEEQVKELIHSRGYAKDGAQRVPVSNMLIEKYLADIDILCIEDLAKVLYQGGEHFARASLFLWPMNLNQSFSQIKVLGVRKKDPITKVAEKPSDFPKKFLQQLKDSSSNGGNWLGPYINFALPRHKLEERRKRIENFQSQNSNTANDKGRGKATKPSKRKSKQNAKKGSRKAIEKGTTTVEVEEFSDQEPPPKKSRRKPVKKMPKSFHERKFKKHMKHI